MSGAQEIEGLRRLERRLANSWSGERESGRQHEGHRGYRRALGILTAGHIARAHLRHVMAAVHVILGGSRRVFVMMGFDRALSGGAARGGVGRPSSGGERGIEQNDGEQAEACGEETPAIVRRSSHVLLEPISVARHYSVTRHSLQAPKKLSPLARQFTIRRILAPPHYRLKLYRWPPEIFAAGAILT